MSLTEESARIARKQLEDGCTTMEQRLRGLLESSGRLAEEIHAIRKLGKSLRGGFSLFGLQDTAGRELQAIGRLLSASRDAVSRCNTWLRLGFDDESVASAAVAKVLDEHARCATSQPLPEAVAWALERASRARAGLPNSEDDRLPRLANSGLKKLRREIGIRASQLERRGKNDFHDLRKAVKAYLGALDFLPPGVVSLDRDLHHLADVLGDENDLATLSAWLKDHGFTRRLVPSLWKSLGKSRNKLQNRAIRDVRKLGLA